MVDDQLRSRGIVNQRILDAFVKVPRHLFVPPSELAEAYSDHPLSIGQGQTISQPYMVAYMLEKSELAGDERVLEIGTGSGYQTALLAELVRKVYTIERIPDLLTTAQTKLKKMNYQNITYIIGDGTLGWPEFAPYDRIIVSAAAAQIPPVYISQIREGGILVIPTGGEYSQELIQATKAGKNWRLQSWGGCVFVKLIGQQGWKG